MKTLSLVVLICDPHPRVVRGTVQARDMPAAYAQAMLDYPGSSGARCWIVGEPDALARIDLETGALEAKP